MNFRPRRARLSREQWLVQRERFQIEPDQPQPTDDHAALIAQPVQKLMKSLGLGSETLQQQLMTRWDAMAGQPLCRHIRPGPIVNGTLTVYVSNSVMLSELSRFQGKQLLVNVQKAVGSGNIKKLRFLIDPDTRPDRK